MNKLIRFCEYCGRGYSSCSNGGKRNRGKRFCSVLCRSKIICGSNSSSWVGLKICVGCGKGFKRIGGNSRKFCSRLCYENNRRIKRRICLFCRRYYIPDRTSRFSKYCSIKCFVSDRFLLKNKLIKCDECGKLFMKRISHIRRNVFCSQLCHSRNMMIRCSNNKWYVFGRYVEMKCIRELEKIGFSCVRSRRSIGPADVVAFKEDEVRMIQVKRKLSGTRMLSYSKDIKRLRRCRRIPGALLQLWILDGRSWKIIGC